MTARRRVQPPPLSFPAFPAFPALPPFFPFGPPPPPRRARRPITLPPLPANDDFIRQLYLISFAGEVAIARIHLEGDERITFLPRMVRAAGPGLLLAYAFLFASIFLPVLVWAVLPTLVWGVVAGVRELQRVRHPARTDPLRHHRTAAASVLAVAGPVPAWVLADQKVREEGLGAWLEAEAEPEAAEIALALADGFDGTLSDLLVAARALASR